MSERAHAAHDHAPRCQRSRAIQRPNNKEEARTAQFGRILVLGVFGSPSPPLAILRSYGRIACALARAQTELSLRAAHAAHDHARFSFRITKTRAVRRAPVVLRTNNLLLIANRLPPPFSSRRLVRAEVVVAARVIRPPLLPGDRGEVPCPHDDDGGREGDRRDFHDEIERDCADGVSEWEVRSGRAIRTSSLAELYAIVARLHDVEQVLRGVHGLLVPRVVPRRVALEEEAVGDELAEAFPASEASGKGNMAERSERRE